MTQVKSLLSDLSSDYILDMTYSLDHEKADEFLDFISDFTSCSNKLSYKTNTVDTAELKFSILKNGQPTGISLRGIPGGHEFSSLLLAILNADEKGKNLPDDATSQRIRRLNGPIDIKTFVSLTCTNCPDVVQTLNIMALLNPNISHTMIDGSVFPTEADAMNIQAVPAVYANGKLIHIGRSNLSELLDKLNELVGSQAQDEPICNPRVYDVLVIGGGPAGSSAAIYSARKGLRVAIVAERIGGQVKETVGIENLISTTYITGSRLANALKEHISKYNIEIFENRKIDTVALQGYEKTVTTKNGEIFKAPAVIIATGAGWRKLGVEGESEYIGHGVAFCPHCDGPFYKDKHVAVIGGGNSGIEAAIDLAGICSKVSVFEFADSLRADTVIQEKAKSLSNVEIFTSSQTTKIIGNGKTVTAIKVRNRQTDEEYEYPLDGIFVQIGLSPNSSPFKEQVEITPNGEIKIDTFCRTSTSGVYAAGDVSTVPYKQIIIAMGEGAKAALSAFDDRIRGSI